MFRTVTLALVCAFLCGCGKPQNRDTGTRATEATPDFGAGDQTSVSLQTNTAQVEGPSTGFDTNGGGPFGGTLDLSLSSRAAPVPPLFNNARASGRGIMRQPDGSIYDGEISNGRPSGQGTVTDERGSNEYGEWRNGTEYRVRGKSVFPDGTTEVGTWNNDGSASGGTIVWPDGRQYKGAWRIIAGAPDVPEGTGAMTWPDGRKYAGWFLNGNPDGPGKMTYPDGKVEDGSWKHGEFTGPRR